MKCCICGEEINGYGNNAEPLAEGECCDRCNIEVVIPYRLALMFGSDTEEDADATRS